MSFKKIFSIFAALIVVATPCLADVAWKRDIPTKKQVLAHRPATAGYAGVLPVAYDAKTKKHYVLLSREAYNGSKDHPKGTYCDFGGKVDYDKKHKHFHTLGSSAVRELYEESCGLYDLRKNGVQKLQADARFFYGLKNSYSYIIAFQELKYIPTKSFKAKRRSLLKRKGSHHFVEKDDFIWVEAASLHQAVSKRAQTRQHTAVTVRVLGDDKKVRTQNIRLRGNFISAMIYAKDVLAKYQ